MTANMETLSQPPIEATQSSQEEWFSVAGDLDDFIFYGQNSVTHSER